MILIKYSRNGIQYSWLRGNCPRVIKQVVKALGEIKIESIEVDKELVNSDYLDRDDGLRNR